MCSQAVCSVYACIRLFGESDLRFRHLVLFHNLCKVETTFIYLCGYDIRVVYVGIIYLHVIFFGFFGSLLLIDRTGPLGAGPASLGTAGHSLGPPSSVAYNSKGLIPSFIS